MFYHEVFETSKKLLEIQFSDQPHYKALTETGATGSFRTLTEPKFKFLHGYQKIGVAWMLLRWRHNLSCLLADDMGLGKTIQAIAFLAIIAKELKPSSERPLFLVVCPKSVVPVWSAEIERCFSRDFAVLKFQGNREQRDVCSRRILQAVCQVRQFSSSELRRSLNLSVMKRRRCLLAPDSSSRQPLIVLTTYEQLVIGFALFTSLDWNCVVFDEAQRLKSSTSMIHQRIRNSPSLGSTSKLLLTGTPIQNNWQDFWSLLNLLAPSSFSLKEIDKAEEILSDQKRAEGIVDLFVLRRRRADIPSTLYKLEAALEVELRLPLTKMQRQLYLALLSQDSQLLQRESSRQSQNVLGSALRNLVMQLRKCASHPYLISGIEPEPFVPGSHLWNVSNKMIMLRRLIDFFTPKHRILIFSGSTQLLNIVQDCLDMTSLQYERLDGSIRGVERWEAIQRFSSTKDGDSTPSLFLLSTRAGGLGLNLMAASVVIFLDNDWNPHIDLQGIARAHRQGQKEKVTVVYLISADTVDEAIRGRAKKKLLLEQHLFGASQEPPELHSYFLAATHGIAALQDKSEDLTEKWLEGLPLKEIFEGKGERQRAYDVAKKQSKNFYAFEGQEFDPYKKNLSRTLKALDQKKPQWAKHQDDLDHLGLGSVCGKPSRKLATHGFPSFNVRLKDSSQSGVKQRGAFLKYVEGDATDPKTSGPWVILFCVDTSGRWPHLGFFKALLQRFGSTVKKYYEALRQCKQLLLGDLHLVPVKTRASINPERRGAVALLIALKRRGAHSAPLLDQDAFKQGLQKLAQMTQKKPHLTVHAPFIHVSKESRYAAERLVEKYIVDAGTQMTFYYYQNTESQREGQSLSAMAALPPQPVQPPEKVQPQKQFTSQDAWTKLEQEEGGQGQY